MTGEAEGRAAVVETHSAVVVMVGQQAYKLKKPVDLGFLDFSTLELRKLAVERELTLNRRMVPDVYLGTARVVDDHEQVLEHLLLMRRMPEDRRLDLLLEQGEDVAKALELIADTLTEFHAAHPVDRTTAERIGSPEFLARLWAGCTSGVREWGAPTVPAAVADEVEWRSRRFLRGRRALFDDRIEHGKIRDGHGDLQASDVFCLADGPRLLDCLDFDDDLRMGDVVSDVAFLTMDLERLHQPAAAAAVMGRFLDLSDAPSALVHFFQAYRAWVRCEVTALRAGQENEPPPQSAARLAEQTLAHLARARVRMICVGGLPGSGKSAIAAGIVAAEPSWVLLSSDQLRDESVGTTADRYSESSRTATYDLMLTRAKEHLQLGRTVVLDSTWGSEQWRAAAATLAEDTVADLIPLEITCPEPVAAQRIRHREPAHDGASEATVEVLAALSLKWASWSDATPIDGAQPLTQAIEAASRACQ